MRIKKYATYYRPTFKDSDDEDCVYVGDDHDKVLKAAKRMVEHCGGEFYEIEVEYEKGWYDCNCYVSLDENGKATKAWCIPEEEYLKDHGEIEWQAQCVDVKGMDLK